MAPRKQPWFRFYVEAVTDVKLARLTPSQKWLWVVVLAAAKQSYLEGFLMLSEREAMTAADLARMADMRERDVAHSLDLMARLGLVELDEDLRAWHVVAWSRRQYESDNVTSRTRKHRSNNNDGTFHQRSSNGDGTHQITDTEPETETDRSTRRSGGTSEGSSSLASPPASAELVAYSQRPRDLLFESLMAVCHVDCTTLTPSSRGSYNKALKDLRSVDATPDDVQQRASNYRMHFPQAALTPPALAKHWALCAHAPSPTVRGADVLSRFIQEGAS